MAEILRGDVLWANLSSTVGHGQDGRRPVLILSNDIFNKYSGTVIAMAVTSQPQKAGFPLTLELDSHQLPKKSWLKISQIKTLSTRRLGEKIGHISSTQLRFIVQGLNEIISQR